MGVRTPTAGPSGANPQGPSGRREVGAVHSSDEAANDRGAKGPHLVDVNSEAKDRRWLSFGGDNNAEQSSAASTDTLPQGEGERRWRAWSLYGDLCRRDVLETALEAVVSNAGAPGSMG